MQKIINSEKVPIKMWLDTAEEEAIQQAKNLANLPYAFSHICLMPDAHVGYGMPIGGILATQNAIIPNAVGVDIGCGMCAVKSNIPADHISKIELKAIVDEIYRTIPVGFNHHKKAQDEHLMPQKYDVETLPIVKQEYPSALKQLGTLGGGNHFIEFQKDTNNFLWLMIHSGSRNIGLKVAEHYNKIAKQINEKTDKNYNPKIDLAYLPCDSNEAAHYFEEMNYCVDFAFANRLQMMKRIMDIMYSKLSNVSFEPIINIAHNYAAWEMHFNTKVLIHRKGATSAKKGEIGIIPGSQGTKSYIVEGLGNAQSFMSCSHGAGRVMSRNKAIKELNLQEEIKKLNEQGIIHGIRKQHDLEEAASAYKNIDQVMEFQKDLVKLLYELTPMAVVKG